MQQKWTNNYILVHLFQFQLGMHVARINKRLDIQSIRKIYDYTILHVKQWDKQMRVEKINTFVIN